MRGAHLPLFDLAEGFLEPMIKPQLATCPTEPPQSVFNTPEKNLQSVDYPAIERWLQAQNLYPASEASPLPWQLAAEPFQLTEELTQKIEALGPVLHRFVKAQWQIYRESVNDQAPGWIANLLDQGKPDALIQLSRMNRFKQAIPLVLRPDLLIGEDGQLTLCELDSIPGGIGLTAALTVAYQHLGFQVLDGNHGTSMVASFSDLLASQAPVNHQGVFHVAIVVSDEANDYRPEMHWLSAQINTLRPEKLRTHVIHPKQLLLMGNRLMATLSDGSHWPIDGIYRFFELFDLPNIANNELIQFALKKGWIVLTPPFKPQLEEKLWLALLHHPALSSLWVKHLGQRDFETLLAMTPQGWVVDPTPLPPQGVIAGLRQSNGDALQDFRQLAAFTQKQRELVLKPSGFSPLAWGSRGVTIGHDVSQSDWQAAIETALQMFSTTPYILQKFRPAVPVALAHVDTNGTIQTTPRRVRLCPYYFVIESRVAWVGALATGCPIDKKRIHGMSTAMLAPTAARF
ncbi:MAG: hypothetical protein VKK59_07750 [Vampirovibrionales bacterium]|nr:hypothetical protein [Vampirovibrionales bacterium]